MKSNFQVYGTQSFYSIFVMNTYQNCIDPTTRCVMNIIGFFSTHINRIIYELIYENTYELFYERNGLSTTQK